MVDLGSIHMMFLKDYLQYEKHKKREKQRSKKTGKQRSRKAGKQRSRDNRKQRSWKSRKAEKQRGTTVEKQRSKELQYKSREAGKGRKAKSREAEKQRSRETEIKKNAQNEQIIQNKALLKQTPPHCLTASTSAEPWPSHHKLSMSTPGGCFPNWMFTMFTWASGLSGL